MSFIVSDNMVADCDEGIYAEMSPDAAQEQLLVVDFNVVTDSVNNGIYVIGGTVNILNNTVMEGTGYGIYVENADGSINGNIVSGFSTAASM